MMGDRYQKGLSLVELMVALVLSLFLLAGVITIFVNTKVGYSGQQALAALQENQRLAASVLSNTVRQAGYYPYSSTNSNLVYFPANARFAGNGQVVYGTNSTIMVRYVTAPNDGVLDCNGGTNTGTTQLFQTDIIGLDPNTHALECATVVTGSNSAGTPYPIVSPLGGQPFNPSGGGISGMHVLYGVAPLHTSSVEQYLDASQITSHGIWMQVRSVMITLDFDNPLYDPKHPDGQPQTVTMTRVINLQNLAQ